MVEHFFASAQEYTNHKVTLNATSDMDNITWIFDVS